MSVVMLVAEDIQKMQNKVGAKINSSIAPSFLSPISLNFVVSIDGGNV